ncbi:MAG: hypothetical protein J6A75_09820 [Lachnospiraceae bacterium]|nr:hypothetical protein [Lachnospiraceae bacterium]
MITEAALNGGSVEAFTEYEKYGLDSKTYNLLKSDIETVNYKTILNNYGYSNTKKNRKLLLYGCAIHTITDAFAHSAAESVDGKWVRIPHRKSGLEDADTTELYSNRHRIACKVAEYAMVNLKNNNFTDGYEVRKAINTVLYGENPKFRLIDITNNLKANGYGASDSVKKVNTDSNQTWMRDGTMAN